MNFFILKRLFACYVSSHAFLIVFAFTYEFAIALALVCDFSGSSIFFRKNSSETAMSFRLTECWNPAISP